MRNLKSNIYFKLGTIVVLTLLLLIPASMVRSLIREREWTQQDAIEEVSGKWALGQTVTGPYLSIPYDRYVKQFSEKDSTNIIVKIRDYIHVLPEKLEINGSINPEKRYRGIYEVVVYDSELMLSGHFRSIDLKELDILPQNIHFDKTKLNLGVSDLKGIEKQIRLHWQNETLDFNSGVANNDLVSQGINAALTRFNEGTLNAFDLTINLKGSQYLQFLPLGKTTDVNIQSQWATPSFDGAYLPDSRNISEKGFEAHWNILHLNRNYPQIWTGSKYDPDHSRFGTHLLLPVDRYKKSDRVAKYAILFLGLTFLVFFFVELLKKVFIHPIQYILVGLALVVFYTLLLAFSEHISFNSSYLTATILTLSIVPLYTYAILKSKTVAGLVLGILLILYLFIFTILQLEDYALLIGSVGIFIILSLVMYISRKIDWYDLYLEKSN
ncbi:MAG: cell envelope integrity protein CreD [Flavobacteriaceae bacterium]|nr:cell envelope integrity protein CreD [Flavobacteriaceae bacterium]